MSEELTAFPDPQDEETNGNLQAENNGNPNIVEVRQGGANQIHAKEVILRQAGAKYIKSNLVQVRQGGVVAVETDRLELTEGGVVFANSAAVDMKSSHAIVILNDGNANIDQSAVQVVATKGNVQIDQSSIVAMVGNQITLEKNNNVVFLLAKNVVGDVKAQFGPKESVLFGLIAGLSAGIVILSGALFGKKRIKKT